MNHIALGLCYGYILGLTARVIFNLTQHRKQLSRNSKENQPRVRLGLGLLVKILQQQHYLNTDIVIVALKSCVLNRSYQF